MSEIPDIAKHYNQMQIRTCGQRRLICLLHEKILLMIRKGSITQNRKDLDKAQNLIAVLDMSLKQEDHTSSLLHTLYRYCYNSLEDPVPGKIENASTIMHILENTFKTVAGLPGTGKEEENSPQRHRGHREEG